MSTDTNIEYPKASHKLVNGGLWIYIGGLFLMVSFFSPYWVSSYDESFTTFKNMGVWEYCFDNFRYPYYQFDKVFDGCRGIFSEEFYVIREWLLPGWLLALQFFITIGLISSLSGQLILASVVTRYPLQFVLRYEYLLSTAAAVASCVTCFCIFFMIIIFPFNYQRRDWLMYPMYIHLSWAYYSLFITFILHFVGFCILYKEANKCWEKRKENRSLVMQMYPSQERNIYFDH